MPLIELSSIASRLVERQDRLHDLPGFHLERTVGDIAVQVLFKLLLGHRLLLFGIGIFEDILGLLGQLEGLLGLLFFGIPQLAPVGRSLPFAFQIDLIAAHLDGFLSVFGFLPVFSLPWFAFRIGSLPGQECHGEYESECKNTNHYFVSHNNPPVNKDMKTL